MRKISPSEKGEKLPEGMHAPRPRWIEWVEKNSKPKLYNFPQDKAAPTRYQKPGPMRSVDWQRFDRWLTKTMSKRTRKPKKPAPSKPKLVGLKQKSLEQRKKAIERLSIPKHTRGKYQIPPPPVYPFAPTLDPMKPAKPSRHRPFEPVKLPFWWYHEELEMEFWRDMRYPISRKALSYKISRNVKNLAEPKKYPIAAHCEIPVREEYEPPKRVKMTKEQWQAHQRRLDYLSSTSYKETRVSKVLLKMKSQLSEVEVG